MDCRYPSSVILMITLKSSISRRYSYNLFSLFKLKKSDAYHLWNLVRGFRMSISQVRAAYSTKLNSGPPMLSMKFVDSLPRS